MKDQKVKVRKTFNVDPKKLAKDAFIAVKKRFPQTYNKLDQ